VTEDGEFEDEAQERPGGIRGFNFPDGLEGFGYPDGCLADAGWLTKTAGECPS
jgi:hypothetical protein